MKNPQDPVEELHDIIYNELNNRCNNLTIRNYEKEICDSFNEDHSNTDKDAQLDTDISSSIDWLVNDVRGDAIETAFIYTVDFLKELNEIDDDDFNSRMHDNPSLFEYRFNPSDEVIAYRKMLEL